MIWTKEIICVKGMVRVPSYSRGTGLLMSEPDLRGKQQKKSQETILFLAVFPSPPRFQPNFKQFKKYAVNFQSKHNPGCPILTETYKINRMRG